MTSVRLAHKAAAVMPALYSAPNGPLDDGAVGHADKSLHRSPMQPSLQFAAAIAVPGFAALTLH
jgi:hypothetical protein